VREVADMDARIRANAGTCSKIYGAADIVRAQSERRIGIIYGFQNAAMLGADASRADLFANLGVRVIQLTTTRPTSSATAPWPRRTAA